MPLRLKGRAATGIIMAIIASTDSTGIVRPAATYKGCGGMAQMAVLCCLDMSIVLADGGNTVTGGAIINNAAMIEHSAYKGSRVMTNTTVLCGSDMTNGFTCGETGCMTGSTVIDNADMRKLGRYKAGSLVTHAAVTIGRHMIRWRYFTRGGGAIVAVGAVINDTLMIEFCADKCICVMT